MKVSFLKRTSFYIAYTVLLLIVLEVILSLFKLFPDDYYTETPNSDFVWKGANVLEGISGPSIMEYDELGSRSISNYKNKTNKIVAFGGSTTADIAITQSKTWTALLDKKLGDSVWVGNFARSGNSSNHHIFQFKHILDKPELSDVKTVLILQGVNDLQGYLVSADKYLNMSDTEIKKAAFKYLPNNDQTFIRSLSLFKLAKQIKLSINRYLYNKESYTQKTMKKHKQLRKQSDFVENLPKLDIGLKHYENNIKKIIDMTRKRKINVVFMTQPTMWDKKLEEKYENMIITRGFSDTSKAYTTEALSKGMEAFNNCLKTVCKQYNIPCIDLQLPKTTATFYDGMHFNESGAQLVSNQVYKFLIKNQILN